MNNATRSELTPPSTEKIDALTGLRWFAALAVVLDHNVPGGYTPRAVTQFFASGSMGVTVFFVLSGFVLAYNYDGRGSLLSLSALRSFYVNRIARIYPLYIATFLFVALPDPGILDGPWWQHVFLLQTWSPNLDFVFQVNAPSWSVSVELFFYACFPLLMVAARKVLRSTRSSVIAFFACSAALIAIAAYFQQRGWAAYSPDDPASAFRWIYRSPLFRLIDFMLGIVAFKFVQSLRGKSTKNLTNALLVSSLIWIFVTMASPWPAESPWKYDSVYAIPSAMLISALAMHPSIVSRFLSTRPLVLLGESSYAFYILMAPLAMFDRPLWFGFTSRGTFAFLFDIGAMIVLGYGAHLLIEIPARTFIKQRLSRRHATQH